MNTVYRILIKIIIFLTTCNMLSILFDKGCYFTFGCALLVISFGVYEFLDTLFKYDYWGESMIPNDNGFVVYGNKQNYYNTTTKTTSNSYRSRFLEEENVEKLAKKFKVREDKVLVLSTSYKKY